MIELKQSLANRIKRQLRDKPLTLDQLYKRLAANCGEVMDHVQFMSKHKILKTTYKKFSHNPYYSIK